MFFCVYFLSKNKWIKCDQRKCEYGECLIFKREQYDIPANSILVIIPTNKKYNPDQTRMLIEPISLRKDNSPVAERASYNFSLKNKTTSYQGEYPYELTKIKNASFFSFDSLRLDLSKDSKSFLI